MERLIPCGRTPCGRTRGCAGCPDQDVIVEADAGCSALSTPRVDTTSNGAEGGQPVPVSEERLFEPLTPRGCDGGVINL